MKRFLKASAAVVVSALISTSASAAPIVTDWNFVIDSGFTEFASVSGDDTITGSATNAVWDAPSILSWGEGDVQSSLSVGGSTNGNGSGSLSTNGAAIVTTDFTHVNNPIKGDTLLSAVLSDKIILDPVLPAIPYAGIPGFSPPALSFDISFLETYNSDDPTKCLVKDSVNPCPDIFVIEGEGVVFNADEGSLTQTFSFLGNNYAAIIIIDNLVAGTDGQCKALGADVGCYGLITQEKETNFFEISLKIESIPEPSVIAIFGLALLTLGASRKKSS